MQQRVELHNHTWFSVLDGLDSPRDSVKRAAELGMPAIACTDHGSLAAHRQFQEACKEFGVKPILGLEAYFTDDRLDKRSKAKRNDGTNIYEHLIVLAKNQQGLENLTKMSELAWTDGYYFKPRCDWELLEKYHEGLIVLSACMGGVLSKPLLADDDETAFNRAVRFKEIFGDDFYIEVQSHNPIELNEALLFIADGLDIKAVATGDCHFVHEHDRELEDAYLVLSTGPKKAPDANYDLGAKHQSWQDKLDALYPDRQMTFKGINLYLQSRDELWEDFASAGINREDIHDNTLDVESKIGEYEYYEYIDTLPQPKEGNARELLRARVAEGMKRRGLTGKPEYEARVVEELEVIEQKKFEPYFILVNDIISWAHSQKIRVGNGRGSACASLVCYALGITNIDPIQRGLLFFRFISPDRKGYPDIDTDIESRRRGEVKEFVMRHYDFVADIATYSYFKDKGVIRDAARVWLVPLGEVNAALRKVATFEDFEESPETQDFRNKYPEVLELARKLRGKIRSTGKHAGGIIVSNTDISNYTSIETRKDEGMDVKVPVVAIDMTDAEKLGLVKQDLLGLKTLSVIEDAIKNIKQTHGITVDIDNIDMDDENVYGMLSAGLTAGVFQVEQPAYTRLLKEMQVSSFEELAASNALVRPGAMNTIGPEYIARKEGRAQIKYIHPDVEHFTRDTFGLATLYQEQLMLLATDLAGMSMREADAVRSTVAKKKDPKLLKQYKQAFIEGASKKIEAAEAEKLWQDIEAAAGYSFNKCLTGDMTVRRNFSMKDGYGADLPISVLYDRWHSKSCVGQKYRGKAGIKIAAYDGDGRVRMHRVAGVYQNGVQDVYRIRMSDGKEIKSTSNHRHMLSDGRYRSIDDGLSVGDPLTTCDFVYQSSREYRIEPDLRATGRGNGWNKPGVPRMIASDGYNRPCIDGAFAEYDKNVALLPPGCDEPGCTSTVKLQIAHVDSNPRNNELSNLRRLCDSHHKRLDYRFGSRKKHGAKGYPAGTAQIVSIESAGREMTYDVEMDTEEHNFFVNGVATHNSHSTAYSVMTYQTAWLKLHYPLEFMAALMANENDGDSLTTYFLECKRLGVQIRLPHVNYSMETFSVEDNEAIRVGLTNIKSVGKAAKHIVKRRPFVHYDDFINWANRKGSGVNKTTIEALNAVGACKFYDNPNPEGYEENWYEYMHVPMFKSNNLPEHIQSQLTPLEDYDEQGCHIIAGLVKGIKRGKGWSRIEFVDGTGTGSAFDIEHTQLRVGQMYIMLIGGNSVARYCTVEEAADPNVSTFTRFLHRDSLKIDEGLSVVLSFNSRMTKKKDLMASTVFSNKDKQLRSALVFPSQYHKCFGMMKDGAVVKLSLKRTKDDSLFVSDVRGKNG